MLSLPRQPPLQQQALGLQHKAFPGHPLGRDSGFGSRLLWLPALLVLLCLPLSPTQLGPPGVNGSSDPSPPGPLKCSPAHMGDLNAWWTEPLEGQQVQTTQTQTWKPTSEHMAAWGGKIPLKGQCTHQVNALSCLSGRPHAQGVNARRPPPPSHPPNAVWAPGHSLTPGS